LNCYFQGCKKEGITKEHIPPRSFFPDDEKEQLMTVRSCEEHNNSKSKDDIYVLAQICMNASPSNRAREVFLNKVAPQLEFNNGALRKRLANGAVDLGRGVVKYRVDVTRLDTFFVALSCGIIFKACGSALPENYEIRNIFHCLEGNSDQLLTGMESEIDKYYSGKPMAFMEFGDPGANNESIYRVKVFGIPGFRSSITIVHEFFGKFKVTSMLSHKLMGSEPLNTSLNAI
jgi:hypothetical protein